MRFLEAMNDWIIPIVGLAFVVAVLIIAWSAYRDFPRLKAECEARGGVLIQASEPLFQCVQPR